MSERRSRVAPLVGAGAAGLTLAFAAAPQALAQTASLSTSAPADPTPTPGSGVRSGAGSVAARPADESATSTTTSTTASPAPGSCEALRADYGYQKFRVGVQIKSGAVVPDGTTTAGTTVTITESGPCVDTDDHTITSTCTSPSADEEGNGVANGKIDAPDDPVINDTVNYCKFPGNIVPSLRAGARADGAPLYFDDFYYTQPGSTITLTQTTVEPNLIMDKVSQTVHPGGSPADNCGFNAFTCASTRAAVIFNDPAPGPDAVDDCTIYVTSGQAALIDVEANDQPNKAPITGLAIAVPPTAGTARVAGTKIRYTADGSSDTDSFEYRITTANGDSQAKVCIGVTALSRTSSVPVTSAPPTLPHEATTDSVSPTTVTTTVPLTTPPLADTGAPTASLSAVGVGLVVIGAGATVAGTRRRRRGRHA